MSTPQVPERAKLIISVLTPQKDAADSAATSLISRLGPIESEIGPLKFVFTSYYDREMGSGIRRWLWVFSDLVDREELAGIKCLTNEVESAYSERGKRKFNLDPGLLTLENFVLATGKNRAHRIYLRQGIFGDLTLFFEKGSYRTLPWTYPDYADPEMIAILNRIRESFKCVLRQ